MDAAETNQAVVSGLRGKEEEEEEEWPCMITYAGLFFWVLVVSGCAVPSSWGWDVERTESTRAWR